MNELRIDTILGELRLIGDERALHAICFSGQAWEYARPTQLIGNRLLDDTAQWILDWLAGTTRAATPTLAQLGTPFQQTVWRALMELPRGGHSSYGALAAQIGNRAAVRALGAAVGRNPWSLLVPCHRVLGANGSLTGYAGGLGRKRALLALERGQDLPMSTVTEPYRKQYSTAMQLRPGASVRWQSHADDGEFPGWSFATDAQQRSAWVPRDWFAGDSLHGWAKRSYDSAELDVARGDRVLELDSFGGWSYARCADGRVGWLPQSILQSP